MVRVAPRPTATLEAAPPTPPLEAPTPTEPPPEGRLFVGELKVLAFTRQPRLSVRAAFMAMGTAAYVIRCGGETQGVSEGERMVAPCLTA